MTDTKTDNTIDDAIIQAIGREVGITEAALDEPGRPVNEMKARRVLRAVYGALEAMGWAVVPKDGHVDMDSAVTAGPWLTGYEEVRPRDLVRAVIAASPKAPGAEGAK
ncbi:hypothetical protein ABNQ39_00250 (plasmid) [Azospirillum sp. A26]|uniref:hypothetical protein n=1 Tax=Azospirillum sp. A26 TaxID=3160607 RepID=UPI00366D8356